MDIGWIRKGLLKPGKSQRGLAQALGVDPAAVNRLLKGERQLKASEIDRAQIYLDEPSGLKGLKVPTETAQQYGTEDRLKVLGMAECGEDGHSLWNGEVVDTVPRPPNLAGAAQAYAVYATGGSMAPRYLAGELVYIHPGRPPTPGCFVLVQMRNPDEGAPPRAFLKRLVKRSGAKVVLEQYDPPKTFNLATDEIISMHRVVGSGEA